MLTFLANIIEEIAIVLDRISCRLAYWGRPEKDR